VKPAGRIGRAEDDARAEDADTDTDTDTDTDADAEDATEELDAGSS
jgi:hypothetical protein